jgi:hypothetical protein
VLEVLEATGLNDGEAAGPSGVRGQSRRSSKLPGTSRALPPGEGVGDMSFDEWAKLVLAGEPGIGRERAAPLSLRRVGCRLGGPDSGPICRRLCATQPPLPTPRVQASPCASARCWCSTCRSAWTPAAQRASGADAARCSPRSCGCTCRSATARTPSSPRPPTTPRRQRPPPCHPWTQRRLPTQRHGSRLRHGA